MKKKLTLVCLAFLAIAAVAVNTAKRAAGDVFSDDFSYVTGSESFKGGSGEDWTGGIAAIKIQSSNAEHEDAAVKAAFEAFKNKWQTSDLSNAYYGDKCIKLGTSSNDGKMTTVALSNLNGAAVVKISAAGWGAGTNKMKVSISDGGTISGEEVTVTNKEYKEFTYNISDGTSESKITISGRRLFIKSVEISGAAAPAVAAPTISGETPFAEQTTVTLACTTEGAEIFYTTNGSEPTAASTKYAEPFVLKATATVKAIAIKGDSQSEIASKDFICSTAPDLAALNVLPDKTAFTFTGEVLVVAKPTAKYVYVRDAKGSSLIYDAKGEKTAAAEVGKTIAANWTGQVSIFKELFEAVPDDNLVMKDGDPVEVSYKTVGLGDVKAENVNMVVALRGVNYTIDEKKNMNITKGDAVAVGYNQFGLEIAAPEEGKTYNMIGAIGRYNDNIQFQPISIEEAIPVDNIEISPESGADIAAVLSAATEGKNVGNITINLAAGGAYTTSASIVAPASVTINGNGATIDASALTTPFIQMATIAEGAELNEKDALVIDGITIKDVTVTGLPYQLIYGNKQKYLMKQLLVENCVIGVNGTAKKTVFDFNSGGNAAELIIDKSTLWANPSNEQNGGLFSSQSGHGSIQDLGSDKQLFAITNSTIYNIACGKTTNSQRRNSTAGMEFKVENSVIVNSGKSGQFVVGLNGGGANSAQTYTISNNIFNFDGADVSAAEEAKVQEKIADAAFNSIAGVIAFTSLETPDFGGVFKLGDGATAPTTQVGDPRWTITYKVMPANIEISPESGADIAAALTAAAEGKNVGNITINLAAGGAYTTSASIVAPASVTINGNGATIDASALTTPFIQMATIAEGAELNEKDALVIDGITIKDVTVTGLPYQLIYGNKQKYLMKQLLVENCVIGVNGTAKKTVFDFNSGGNAAELIIDKSTLWANPSNEQNGGLFSSQSGHGSIQDLGSDKQLFAITNSTIYNIACGKTTNSQRRNSTAGMEFKVENSVIVNSGKSGQFVVGLNGGGANSAQTYTISNNIFNFDGADVSAAEEAKVQEKIADAAFNSIAGVIAFTSLETPDFGGVFKLGEGATAPTTQVGDPRWTITYEKDAPAKLYLITGNWDRTNMIDVPFNNETQAYEYETAPEGKMWFAFADKQLTAEEAEADPNWTDFNTNHRYAIGAGDVDASLNEALPLLKIEGTLVLEPVPAGKVYKISVAKDWSTVTITVEDPTGIQSISSDKFAEGEWYTIQGVRVEKPAKGIFIHNGRKVVVK